MKLIKHGEPGQEKPGILKNGTYYDVSHLVDDYDEKFFAGNALKALKGKVQSADLKEVDPNTRLGSPIARPSKIICIGLNYKDHAEETGADLPKEPIIFFKATSSMVGPNDDLIIPKNSEQTDWEVEFGVVIGKEASYVKEEDAMNHVAGYALNNDYSERSFQFDRGGQWVKGKSNDTFSPIGPFVATPDEIDDVNNLNLWLDVNGKQVQNGTTADLIFGIPFIISHLSEFMTLLPGDFITTGTPAGVGLGQKPDPWFLKDGDVVELGIDGLGSSKQHVKAYSK